MTAPTRVVAPGNSFSTPEQNGFCSSPNAVAGPSSGLNCENIYVHEVSYYLRQNDVKLNEAGNNEDNATGGVVADSTSQESQPNSTTEWWSGILFVI